MRAVFGAALALGAMGCKVVDAPDNLEELMVFGFETFGDERSMTATVDELMPLVDVNEEDLIDGYRVSTLGATQLEAAGVEDASVEGIVGAMGLVEYTNALDPILDIITSHDKDTLFEQIEEFSAEDLSDRDCFLARECDTFSQRVDETARVSLLGASERTYTHTLQWIEHEEHGTVLAIRSLSPDPIEFSTNIVNVNQQYGLAYMYDDGGGTRRVEAFWVDAELIGMDVPDSFAVDNAVNAMADQAENIDNILDGVE